MGCFSCFSSHGKAPKRRKNCRRKQSVSLHSRSLKPQQQHHHPAPPSGHFYFFFSIFLLIFKFVNRVVIEIESLDEDEDGEGFPIRFRSWKLDRNRVIEIENLVKDRDGKGVPTQPHLWK